MHPIPVLIISLALALGVFFIVRRFPLGEMFASEFNFLNVVARIVGTIFGLFLAFTIILGWGRYTEARRTMFTEITCLSLIERNAAVFPPEARDRVSHLLHAYIQSVIKDEWPAMAADQGSPRTQQLYRELWDFYTAFTPENEHQRLFHRRAVGKLNELGAARRLRLLYCQTTFITPVLIFLFFGGMVMVGISYCFPVKNVWFHVVLIAIVTIIIAFSIFLAYEMQNPFSGFVTIEPDAFQELLAEFGQRR
ncbi:MAG: DUF4239 domain-containing protein [Deltaproteobacteria bacterium]|nr:MAG: DUF4239 domain-containing protein [Deltaproteobacteria bacterium]